MRFKKIGEKKGHVHFFFSPSLSCPPGFTRVSVTYTTGAYPAAIHAACALVDCSSAVGLCTGLRRIIDRAAWAGDRGRVWPWQWHALYLMDTVDHTVNDEEDTRFVFDELPSSSDFIVPASWALHQPCRSEFVSSSSDSHRFRSLGNCNPGISTWGHALLLDLKFSTWYHGCRHFGSDVSLI